MTSTATTVDEYLCTTFEHEAEYVDGRIVERPWPIYFHALMQAFLAHMLRSHGFKVLTEQRAGDTNPLPGAGCMPDN